MSFFQNKYRIESTRLRDYDYSSDGYYFVTICVQDRAYDFGNIINSQIKLSRLGEIVRQYWGKISEHFRNTKLDAFIVMPNHVHGLIIINNYKCRDTTCRVSTKTNATKRQFGKPQSKSLARIIGSYKSTVTRWANKNSFDYFQWQSNYYDHILLIILLIGNVTGIILAIYTCK